MTREPVQWIPRILVLKYKVAHIPWKFAEDIFPKPHHLLPHLNPDWLTQVVLEKRGCETGVVVVLVNFI